MEDNRKLYDFKSNEISQIQDYLLSWYKDNKRDLPWRRYRDHVCNHNDQAYSVWVSEIMLQQTRVPTVVDYYNRWIEKWPNILSLSKASLDDVNQMWSGLGYYSRAKRLLEGACKVMKDFDGKLPSDAASLMKHIPGIGRYTASAIASIAFNEPVGVVDGNVIRVLCRMRAIGGDIQNRKVISHLWSLSNALVDEEQPGDFNQALMELGAVVCTPKNPKCAVCPVKIHCTAFIELEHFSKNSKSKILSSEKKVNKKVEPQGENKTELADIEDCADYLALSQWLPELGVENYPVKVNKKSPRLESVLVIVVELVLSIGESKLQNVSKLLVAKRPDTGLLAGLWEFPNEISSSNPKLSNTGRKRKLTHSNFVEKSQVLDFCNRTLSIAGLSSYKMVDKSYVGEYFHKFSHIHQANYVYKIKVSSSEQDFGSCGTLQWVSLLEFETLAKSTLVKNIFNLCYPRSAKHSKSLKKNLLRDKKQSSIKSYFHLK